jgi:hypothetical protein
VLLQDKQFIVFEDKFPVSGTRDGKGKIKEGSELLEDLLQKTDEKRRKREGQDSKKNRQ